MKMITLRDTGRAPGPRTGDHDPRGRPRAGGARLDRCSSSAGDRAWDGGAAEATARALTTRRAAVRSMSPVFTVLEREAPVLLVRVGRGAFAGRWRCRADASRSTRRSSKAARRQLASQTGVRSIYLEKLYTSESTARSARRSCRSRTSR